MEENDIFPILADDNGYKETERQIAFETEAADDLQITLEVEPEKEYKVFVNDTNIGKAEIKSWWKD